MDFIRLKLTNSSKTTLIDKEDYSLISKYKWCIDAWGYVINTNRKRVKLHRIIMNAQKGQAVDHVSMDKLDNRKCNLRFATKSQNAMNTKVKSNNKTGYKGVSLSSMRKGYYAAYITINQKHKFLGHFRTPEEAAQAYDKAAKELFGEFARISERRVI